MWSWSALLAGTAVAQVDLPPIESADPIHIRADVGHQWHQGAYEVWWLRGRCQLQQGSSHVASEEALLWVLRGSAAPRQTAKIIAYFEGRTEAELALGGKPTIIKDNQWLGRFSTAADVQIQVDQAAARPEPLPSIYDRAMAQREPKNAAQYLPTQYTAPIPSAVPAPAAATPPGTRRIRVYPRSEAPLQAKWYPDPTGREWIAVLESGVNVVVDGLPNFGSIDVSADRVVIWTAGIAQPGLPGAAVQPDDAPLELYLEGNVVFLQGSRQVTADRMYYNVRQHRGTVINAEILTPVPKFEGLVRLHTELLQQFDQDRFFAQNSFLTSSRMGGPGYRLEVGDVYFEDFQRPVVDPVTGQPAVDPATDQPLVEHQRVASGYNSFLYLGSIPVFYWPFFKHDLTTSSYYIRRAKFGQDTIFGTQIYTDWDTFQILGMRRPEGMDWDLSLDYLSQRGIGHGTTFTYNRDEFFGWSGPVGGLVDYWGIADYGVESLPFRPALPAEVPYRYRLLWKHRQQLPNDFQLTAEAGFISDRNFLEEYFLREWQDMKDMTTGLELKRSHDNHSFSITGDVRVNDFFTQTDWLPRLDHFWLGQPVANDTLSWYEHSNIGYGRFHPLVPPSPTRDAYFRLLPWESLQVGGSRLIPQEAAGERLATRQEIDLPVQLGPVKVVPYALGELAHWGQDLEQEPFDRAYGQVGLRASVPFWSVNPLIESDLLNVHGIAHKIVFDTDLYCAAATRHLNENGQATLPLYDPLDDDVIEAFRRRFAFTTYGSYPVGINTYNNDPNQIFFRRYDERLYAVRSGLASWVSSPSTEIADDLVALRLGAHQRWQTKRGMPGARRVTDWITLDTNLTFFPQAERDDFGSAVGLADYDLRWYVGERLTLYSNGIYDFFEGGQGITTVGAVLARPPRGLLGINVTTMEGPAHSRVLSVGYSYWMSPKWLSSAGMSVDFGEARNIGQSIAVTRVGESFLMTAGFNVDAIRGNVGATFMLEPRFLPKGKLGMVGGTRIPVAGAYGLE